MGVGVVVQEVVKKVEARTIKVVGVKVIKTVVMTIVPPPIPF